VAPHPLTKDLRQSIYADATAHIARADDRQPTVDEVARAIATSRRQLQRVFREVGGTSFREYVVAARLDRARCLLLQELPIGEVSRRCGYTHASHFTRAFRRRHGITPSALVGGESHEEGFRVTFRPATAAD
jgi:AraC family transcriptional regulator, regulatory protein of adaptative response / methylphosphotriester-DNA alkyltransferase methyltransferase